mgnify:FL=1
MENKIVKSVSNLVVQPPEQDIDRSAWSGARRWRVDVSYSHHVFINDHERDYFLQELARGKKIIKVGEMVLTNKFLAITKVR